VELEGIIPFLHAASSFFSFSFSFFFCKVGEGKEHSKLHEAIIFPFMVFFIGNYLKFHPKRNKLTMDFWKSEDISSKTRFFLIFR
jgi:hypothetical protein